MSRASLSTTLITAVQGLAIILSACAGRTEEAPASPTPSAVTTSSAPSAVPADLLVWSEPHLVPDDGTLLDVVRWRSGYVAVGVGSARPGEPRVGAAYTSTDGMEWRRSAGVSDPGPALRGVIALRAQLLAVANEPSQGVRAWTSGDGLDWRRDDALFLPNEWVVGAIAGTDDVAVVATTDAARRTRIHRSVAGAAWHTSSLPPQAIVRGLTPIDDGFLAFGRSGQPDTGSSVGLPGVGRPAAWWSADGEHWTDLPVDGVDAAGAQLVAVYRVADRFLAIGSDSGAEGTSSRSPLVWTSPDGHAWRLVGPPAHWGYAVATAGRLVIFTPAASGPVDLAAWSTQDGGRWTQLAFAGDMTHVPAYSPGTGRSIHLDELFSTSAGIVVVGQMNGRHATWLAEMRP